MGLFERIKRIFTRKARKMKTFDIMVYTDGADGKVHQQHVSGVKASSRRELIGLYAMTGEKIQIISEQDDGKPESKPQTPQNASAAPAEPAKKPTTPAQQKPPEAPPVQPSKFFKIGDIECKYDNGKVYQRQWMKLSPSEAANYRVIQDSSNKIVSMNGKHIEKLSWVQISDQEEKESDPQLSAEIEEIVNDAD
jgi:hypothetical protein